MECSAPAGPHTSWHAPAAVTRLALRASLQLYINRGEDLANSAIHPQATTARRQQPGCSSNPPRQTAPLRCAATRPCVGGAPLPRSLRCRGSSCRRLSPASAPGHPACRVTRAVGSRGSEGCGQTGLCATQEESTRPDAMPQCSAPAALLLTVTHPRSPLLTCCRACSQTPGLGLSSSCCWPRPGRAPRDQ